jgi:hypothetical protein
MLLNVVLLSNTIAFVKFHTATVTAITFYPATVTAIHLPLQLQHPKPEACVVNNYI